MTPGSSCPSPGRCACEALLARNPATSGMLGLCPMLAVSTSVAPAVALGLVTTAVLAVAAATVSATRGLVPGSVRLPAYMLVVSTAVIFSDLLLTRHFFELSERLGIFLPLVITNCVVLARLEAHASRSGPASALADALSCGIGLTLAIAILALMRTLLASGAPDWGLGLLGWEESPGDGSPLWRANFFLTPAGGFITFGLLAAAANAVALKAGFRPSAAGTSAPTS